MKTPEEIKTYIKSIVDQQLPSIEPAGVREWISERITEPYPVHLPVDPEGKHIYDFWIVTEHKDGQHYRIAYSVDDDSFGIVTPLASGIDWYMGSYGSFKRAAESM